MTGKLDPIGDAYNGDLPQDPPDNLDMLPPIPDTEKDWMLAWSADDGKVKWIETTEECPELP